jgi:hypothetical protein
VRASWPTEDAGRAIPGTEIAALDDGLSGQTRTSFLDAALLIKMVSGSASMCNGRPQRPASGGVVQTAEMGRQVRPSPKLSDSVPQYRTIPARNAGPSRR